MDDDRFRRRAEQVAAEMNISVTEATKRLRAFHRALVDRSMTMSNEEIASERAELEKTMQEAKAFGMSFEEYANVILRDGRIGEA